MTKLGKLWTGAVAYVSLLVGAGLSVAGNLADTYRTRGPATDTLDQVMAAGWPILVLLAIEMFVSPRWSAARMFQVWRWTGCLAVGGMAMVVSWTHLHDLMSSRGQMSLVSVLGPLAIDGMAIMATGLILSTRTRGQQDRTADTGQDTWADRTTDNIASVLDTDTGQDNIADTGQDTDTVQPDSGQAFWTPDVVLPEDWTAKLSDLSSGHVSLRGHLSQDTPLPRRTPDMDKLGELSVADEAEEFLSRLSSQTPTLPVRVRFRVLSEDQRTEVSALMSACRECGHYTPAQGRALLAAWYGVSSKTISRIEGR
jgi:hypothetical protein